MPCDGRAIIALSDETGIGGCGKSFATTRWTEILSTQAGTEDQRRLLLGTVMARYWKPVYSYLRRKGHDSETSKDLTQEFFQEVMLGRDLVSRADPARGRFRNFLLSSLNRYVVSVHRADRARKRYPVGGLVSIDSLGELGYPPPAHEATPEAAFHYAWAAGLVGRVLSDLDSAAGTAWRRTGSSSRPGSFCPWPGGPSARYCWMRIRNWPA